MTNTIRDDASPSSQGPAGDGARSLLALAERCEKATEGSREIDAMIECEVRRWQAYALGIGDKDRSHWKPTGSKGEVIDHQQTIRYHAPEYSFSIDAALTLVPEGMDWRVDTMTGLPGAIVCVPNAWLSHKTAPLMVRGATPALALCAAALRARAHQTGGSGE